MGKKNKADNETGPPGTIPNRDLMQRMNFLYQASVHLQNAAGRTWSDHPGAGREMRRLARKHVKTLKGIASGAVVKIDPTIKRVLCKKCSTVLVPGSTASVRVKSSGPHGKVVSYTCFACNERRVIPAPPTKSPRDEETRPSGTDTQAPGPSQLQDRGGQQLSARRSKERPLPSFARLDAGHVVYRGTERVEENE
ncbi:RNase P Rpr2/Rpp21 subunit domain protein [Ceratobasidium sp. AG-Ba]|nr:RNase P Rpr2/Rpp21 subunit domain protein [Ceratobasidium sp. AG-Ba]QRW07987.1 RNase P Rpr2/Rpp21 subunit domain protein [Ceratobasidium sp. AG-Ba]